MRSRVRRSALAAAAAALVLAVAVVSACSGSSSTTLGDGGAHTTCVPGQSVACVGAGGCAGGQVCSLDGTHYGACDCSAGGPDAASGSDATTPGMDATTPVTDAPTGSEGSAKDSGLFGGDAGCPPGLTCNVGCPGGGSTTISGTVYDPAVKNPVYGAVVYVPSGPLPLLPKGVPSGAAACSCGALFPSAVVAHARTGPDGRFTLTNVPVGSAVPLVIQIGKWRRLVHVDVTACQDNAQPAGSLALPATVAPGSDDNIPDIAVSTGGADTLECLLLRMGLSASEYVAGAATTGHIHMFSGGNPAGPLGNANVGVPETTPFPGAPASPDNLWSNAQQLLPYDITLLSCEGGETYDANPAALEAYLNAGGRVFASHYHYTWFAGPILSMQSYAAPMDWGSNLATWSGGDTTSAPTLPIGGVLDTLLNGKTTPFPKGVAFQQWLTFLQSQTDGGVLGADGVDAGELPIYEPRYNAVVGPTDTPSQAWISSDATGMLGQTMLFSFNTPVTPAAAAPACGRAVFSDIHAEGNPATVDTPPAPGGCANVDLSPQEKALEFVLFDLSACVVPDSANP